MDSSPLKNGQRAFWGACCRPAVRLHLLPRHRRSLVIPSGYEAAARIHETIEASVPQKNNGHVLEQTVWNYQFEPGTDRLTTGGVQHLAYLVRRRPAADPMVYVQTSQDLTMDSTNIERFC